jgi:hypothetical protein
MRRINISTEEEFGLNGYYQVKNADYQQYFRICDYGRLKPMLHLILTCAAKHNCCKFGYFLMHKAINQAVLRPIDLRLILETHKKRYLDNNTTGTNNNNSLSSGLV